MTPFTGAPTRLITGHRGNGGGAATPTRRGGAAKRRAFSMIEAAIAMVILGGLLAASLSVVEAISRMRRSVNEQEMARLLAEDLMAEILAAAYEEPDGSEEIGTDAGEDASDRFTFDDVDDYNGWLSAPVRRDGSALTAQTGWTVRVSVQWVSPTTPGSVSGSETGAKRIVVQADRAGRRLASLTVVRTAAWGTGS